MKPGDTVITPDGEGVIKRMESFSRVKRYGVLLNCFKRFAPLKFYWKNEIKLKEKRK